MRDPQVNPIETYILDLRNQLKELGEIDLDLSNTLDSFMQELLQNGFQWFGLRQLDYSKPCSCKSQAISEKIGCVRCFRTGYAFTDYLVKGYLWISSLGFETRTAAGDISTQRKNLVVRHDRLVNKFDHILELDINHSTGEIIQPFKIVRSYSVQDSLALYGLGGRVEFWRCAIEERNIDDGRYNQTGPEFVNKGNRSNAEPK